MTDTGKLTVEQLCGMIDHTLLKAYATEDDLRKLCDEARDSHFAMVAINSFPVSFCKSLLEDTDIHVGAAISFPLGQTTIETKCFETMDAIRNGADEIDYVVNVSKVKMHDYDYIRKEMEENDRRERSGLFRHLVSGNCSVTELIEKAGKLGMDLSAVWYNIILLFIMVPNQ